MHEFNLEKKQQDGNTLRDHLSMAYQATGIMPEDLEAKEMPSLGLHVWKYFLELHNERSSNGMGPNKINSTQIKDWCFISSVTLEPWEVRAIRALDNAWMESII